MAGLKRLTSLLGLTSLLFKAVSAAMNSHYQVAVAENNAGVALLEAGDYRSALERFSHALKYTMGDLDPQAPTEKDQSIESLPDDFRIPSRKRSESGEPPMTTRPKTRHEADGESRILPPVSAPFAYGRGINLILHTTAYSPDPLVNATIVSSIIIFNLSIIYHFKGLEARSMSDMQLRKAKSLYQKAHNLLRDAGVPMGATSNPVIDMLSMAIFNNLGHITYELQAYQESRQHFDHLIRFALTVVPARYGDAYVGSLIDQQKSNFLLNAIILQAPKLAAAA